MILGGTQVKKRKYLQMGLAVALGQLVGASGSVQAFYAGETVGDNVTIEQIINRICFSLILLDLRITRNGKR